MSGDCIKFKSLDEELIKKICPKWSKRHMLLAVFGSQNLLQTKIGAFFGQVCVVSEHFGIFCTFLTISLEISPKFSEVQLPTFAYIRLLNKPYENEVTLTGQKPP